MAMEFRFGLTELSTKASGKMTWPVVREGFITQTAIYTRVSGGKIEHTALGFTLTLMVLGMRDFGLMTSRTGGAKRLGQTGLRSKGSSRMGRKMARESTNGQMVLNTRVSGKITSSTEAARTNGQMEGFTRGNGKIT